METFAVRARSIVHLCENEEQTKVSLINPYLEMLGYDVRDPRYVRLEVRADIHTGNEKVDYAILREDRPWMVVEAKKASVPLGDEAPDQADSTLRDGGRCAVRGIYQRSPLALVSKEREFSDA